MLYLYFDSLYAGGGGINTYLFALATRLQQDGRPFEVFVVESTPVPLVDELAAQGVKVYRQSRIPGDRWCIRKRVMQTRLSWKLRPGDWVFSLCPPDPHIYHRLVKLVHRRGARLAVSWYLSPEFWRLDQPNLAPFRHYKRAVLQTDLLVSVSHCAANQFREIYGYQGEVAVIPYHNLPLFDRPLPLPKGPPWKIGFAGRMEAAQKNLDGLLRAFAQTPRTVELHLHGGGPSADELGQLAAKLGVADRVFFHGPYDYRHDLKGILGSCHLFVYPSRSEGGPCFSVLEMLQAGRFCVASDVGGLPDVYAGHPEAGLLVPRENHAALVAALLEAVGRASRGEIDGAAVRARYFQGFDMEAAHGAFVAVFGDPERRA